jgi:hypothetical protein
VVEHARALRRQIAATAAELALTEDRVAHLHGRLAGRPRPFQVVGAYRR